MIVNSKLCSNFLLVITANELFIGRETTDMNRNRMKRFLVTLITSVFFLSGCSDPISQSGYDSIISANASSSPITSGEVSNPLEEPPEISASSKPTESPKAPNSGNNVPSDSEAQTDFKEQTVYITKTGEKYHRSGCRYLKKSKISVSLEDAVASGYSPCKVCKP